MHFADLTPLNYSSPPWKADCWRAPFLAVGWLEKEGPPTRGDSPVKLLLKLREHVEGARQAQPHINFRGLHTCALCEQAEDGLQDSHINILIPGDHVVYAAPAAIIHYVESHNYLPPTEFIQAVLRCPKYGSPEFYEALRASNLGEPIPLEHWEDYLKKSAEEWRKTVLSRAGDA